MRTPFPRKDAVEKKLTFKPAIKTKNVKSLILKAPPARSPLRGGDSWPMRITPGWQPYFSDIANRARSVPRRRPEIHVQRYVYRVGLLQNPGLLYAEF